MEHQLEPVHNKNKVSHKFSCPGYMPIDCSEELNLPSGVENRKWGVGNPIHHSIFFFRFVIISLFLVRLPYLELDPRPWKHYPPSSPPSPNFSWFFGYILAIFGLIAISGSPPPIKSNIKIVWPNEKLMKSSQWNEKQPIKSTDSNEK